MKGELIYEKPWEKPWTIRSFPCDFPEGDHFPDGASENEETFWAVLQNEMEVMKPINQQRWYL
jgi:hypothetical protein